MTSEEITRWALSNGWRLIDGLPSLTAPSSPSAAIVRLTFDEVAANIEVRMPKGGWGRVSGARYDDVTFDPKTGKPRGLGLEDLAAQARSVLSSINVKDVFVQAYENKLWGAETASGTGSTIEATANLRADLPVIYNRFNIRSVLDAPCGDLNWMQLVLEATPGVDYIGADIVDALVKRNAENFSRSSARFMTLDITKDNLPEADLMICRDCLFHLPQRDIFAFFTNFMRSNIKFLLTTSYVTEGKSNADIHAGFFFPIDLLAEPYNFPREVLYTVNDWTQGHRPRQMFLWDKSQIPAFPEPR